MSEAKKCTNPACTCLSTDHENFCSGHCEEIQHAIENAVEMVCRCGHPGCGRAALEI
jgi:hypothetical protein